MEVFGSNGRSGLAVAYVRLKRQWEENLRDFIYFQDTVNALLTFY
jgi:hypothetical protein